MGYKLGTRSEQRLKGVHPDLIRVVRRAIEISPIDFTVLEGKRTVERQRELFAKKATRTMRSRHIHGFAVDLAPLINGEVRWDWPLYNQLSKVVKQAAKDVKVPVEWGGDWTFKDGPHWQLPHKLYPDPKK
jgi:peptidoglycan L-alanyl-D-glutamate endopeptidase CwlK